MSFSMNPSMVIARSGPSTRRALTRSLATATTSSTSNPTRSSSSSIPDSTSSSSPKLTASLLLSRPPLLTPTPTQLESAYYAYSLRLRRALSNPVPTSFYFKPGSLPFRRFKLSEHSADLAAFGPRVAGAVPDVGEVQDEPELVEFERGFWAEKDKERGDKSLERKPEEELFCMIKKKDDQGKWVFPSTKVEKGEGLDQAVKRAITGVKGELNGTTLDTWIVTRKPIGMIKSTSTTNFFLRSHVLAGEPSPPSSAGIESWAWLTTSEVEARLKEQGDDAVWDAVKGMFGVSSDPELDGLMA